MRTMKKRILGVFVLAAMLILAMTFTSCEGPEGPQGPAGGVDPNCVHAWMNVSSVNTSTCTESGKQITRTCLKCSAVVEGNVTDPLGHLLTGTVILSTQPTEATDGTATGVHCTRIGCTAIESLNPPVTIPAWNKFYGTWICTTGTYQPYTITISATELKWFDKDGDGTKITSLQMIPTVVNSLGGYNFTGTGTVLGGGSGSSFVTITLNGEGKIVDYSQIFTKQE